MTLILQGLEDNFDGRNSQDVQHLIRRQIQQSSGVVVDEPEIEYSVEDEDDMKEKYFIQDDSKDRLFSAVVPRGEAKALLELARLPTCAVFHRLTVGRGVPHSFAGFIRQWPALPRVVVRISQWSGAYPYIPDAVRCTDPALGGGDARCTCADRVSVRRSQAVRCRR